MATLRMRSLMLRLLLAACALLAGVDVHLLEFASPSAHEATAAAGIEAHGDSCPHREHVPPAHSAHDCLLCKTGAARATGLQPDVAVRPVAMRSAWVTARIVALRPASCVFGSLGARGPPGTDA